MSACAARLRESGVEPANFDTAAAAADVDELRKAMGVDTWWGAGSYGTQSRVLFRYLHDFPGRLEAAWLDSPWFPETDDLTGGALGTRSALAELFSACAADDHCNRRYPDLEKRGSERSSTRPSDPADRHAARPLTIRQSTWSSTTPSYSASSATHSAAKARRTSPGCPGSSPTPPPDASTPISPTWSRTTHRSAPATAPSA